VQRLQHGRFDGALHTQPAHRQARGGATIHSTAPPDIPRAAPCGAPRGDSELATAPAPP
jgi:hypothetical protein